MRTYLKHFAVAGALALMLGFTGIAVAVPSNEPHTDPALLIYPTCPRHDLHVASSTTAESDAKLVPAGAHRVLLCRYSGLPRGRLLAHRVVTSRSTTRGLARAFDALKPATGVRSCPADDGQAVVAFVRYGTTGKSDDPVQLNLSGCRIATNGHLHSDATTDAGARLVRRLEALIRRS